LRQLWNLGIEYPNEDLLQHSDDINAAFRCGTYHCDIAIIFAYVFMEFLIIPVEMIFGACNAPSWWDIMANWHSHLGTTKDYSNKQYDIVNQVQLVPDLTNTKQAIIPPAIADSQNQGIPAKLKHHGHISMFVDDNCSINIHSVILNNIYAAVGSAYDCFGFPEVDHRLPCLCFEKFEITADFIVFHLGFQICMRTMQLILPAEQKRQAL
jgi:hypothetical protein